MKDKNAKETGKDKPGDWTESQQGDPETRRVLQIWKGKRFLKRLRKWCMETEPGQANEGTRR